MASADVARKQWEAENKVYATDDYYRYSKEDTKELHKKHPWRQSPKYFTKVKMSALALVKMIMHAKTGKGKAGRISSDSGNWIEVMGVMQGYCLDGCFVVLDSFALPVEAHEVECNLTQAATEYLVTYIEKAERVGKGEPMVGWYHSHPGYQCFLSKTDCVSQRRYQQYSDPFVAVVVDPVRTISSGKVEAKAFRTLPEADVSAQPGKPAPGTEVGDKISEMGVFAHWYYELPIEVFKSSADEDALTLLWGKFWSSTLASSPLATNKFFIDRQMASVEKQLEKAEGAMAGSGVAPARYTSSSAAAAATGTATATADASKAAQRTEQMRSAVAESDSLAGEVLHGLLGMAAKNAVFCK